MTHQQLEQVHGKTVITDGFPDLPAHLDVLQEGPGMNARAVSLGRCAARRDPGSSARVVRSRCMPAPEVYAVSDHDLLHSRRHLLQSSSGDGPSLDEIEQTAAKLAEMLAQDPDQVTRVTKAPRNRTRGPAAAPPPAPAGLVAVSSVADEPEPVIPLPRRLLRPPGQSDVPEVTPALDASKEDEPLGLPSLIEALGGLNVDAAPAATNESSEDAPAPPAAAAAAAADGTPAAVDRAGGDPAEPAPQGHRSDYEDAVARYEYVPETLSCTSVPYTHRSGIPAVVGGNTILRRHLRDNHLVEAANALLDALDLDDRDPALHTAAEALGRQLGWL